MRRNRLRLRDLLIGPPVVLFLLLCSAPKGGAQEVDYTPPEGPSLRALAEARGLLVGGNLTQLVIGNPPYNWESPQSRLERSIAADQFNIVSAGYQMYPGYSWTGPSQYRFEGTATLLDWCRAHDIQLHGHGLGYATRVNWFKQLPAGTEAQRARVRKVYEAYVRDTAHHFRDQILVWDVCNEQLQVPYGSPGFRTGENYWRSYQEDPAQPQSGQAWYARTLTLARQTDPKASLLLLDFNNEILCPKSDTFFDLALRLKQNGVPLDGVGFQMHLDTDLRRSKGQPIPEDDAYFASMRRNFERFAEAGLDIWITEMSVAIDPEEPLETELERQAVIYGRVFETALAVPSLRGIKTWGVQDRPIQGRSERPYLFDEAGRPKPAYFAVRRVLQSAPRRDPTPAEPR